MNIKYDPSVDIAYIYLRDTKIVDSEEVSSGVILDYDEDDEVVGIEILHIKQREPDEMKSVYRQNLREEDQRALEKMFNVTGAIAV